MHIAHTTIYIYILYIYIYIVRLEGLLMEIWNSIRVGGGYIL